MSDKWSVIVEPSNAEQADWPETTHDYVHGLEAEITHLRAERDALRVDLLKLSLFHISGGHQGDLDEMDNIAKSAQDSRIEALESEIVELWHANEAATKPLYEYLHMTQEQYAAWAVHSTPVIAALGGDHA